MSYSNIEITHFGVTFEIHFPIDWSMFLLLLLFLGGFFWSMFKGDLESLKLPFDCLIWKKRKEKNPEEKSDLRFDLNED